MIEQQQNSLDILISNYIYTFLIPLLLCGGQQFGDVGLFGRLTGLPLPLAGLGPGDGVSCPEPGLGNPGLVLSVTGVVTLGEAGADTVDTLDRGDGGAPGHRFITDDKCHRYYHTIYWNYII